MRIACIDRSAEQRLSLQKFLDEAFSTCSSSATHLSFSHTYSASAQEAVVNTPPQLIVIGPSFSIEEAFVVCKDLRHAHNNVPIFLFLSCENFTLRALSRFDQLANEIFSIDEPPIRIIHKVFLYCSQPMNKKNGMLWTVNGAKGGVGTTSIVSGLAHAALCRGQKIVVMDLSATNAFACYLGANRLQSSEYATILSESLTPDEILVQRCLVTVPNGISIILSPSGGREIREQWLRDTIRYEVSIKIVDILLDLFNIVIVDIASAEGLLPFALNCRADKRLLISSNDPSSVHLLNTRLFQLAESQGSGEIKILLNLLNERSLSKEDILDFLSCNQYFHKHMLFPISVPYDKNAKNWIGTGNSFYIEGNNKLQKVLDKITDSLCRREEPLKKTTGASFWHKLKRLIKYTKLEKRVSNSNCSDSQRISSSLNSVGITTSEAMNPDFVYQPPKLVVNSNKE